MVTDFRKTLDKFKVPRKEQDELVALVGTTKPDIVVVDGKKSAARRIAVEDMVRAPTPL
jgi:hypothetical protein